jgi:hypothetical protein
MAAPIGLVFSRKNHLNFFGLATRQRLKQDLKAAPQLLTAPFIVQASTRSMQSIQCRGDFQDLRPQGKEFAIEYLARSR